ncbi:fatty acid synthase [Galendromus occidentalis]|uniref:Fatty acid synthase n=1 Tax=Galendromus occidentalis TaxID=34638 RepID=A0AAJ6VVX5_9ACAR|nr:fatty acid synthase [Galendromus occidentalis]
MPVWDKTEDVVLTGISGYFPQCDSFDEFKEKLFQGVDMVTDDELRWPRGLLGLPARSGKIKDLSRFDARFFGVTPRLANLMDPQLRMLLETTYEAIVDAGYEPRTLRGRKIGVYVGVTYADSDDGCIGDVKEIDGYSLTGCCRAMFANRISYSFDFTGPSLAIDSACSSSISALTQAMIAIRSNQCDAAIVGGSQISLKPQTALGFHKLSLLDPEGKCRAFDNKPGGYARSEAVGCVFLQRRSDARRIYATVVHAKANVDGFKEQGILCPSGRTQEMLLREIYSETEVDPTEVEYVEAHGTGTKAGDPQELSALYNVLCPGRDGALHIGSVKSNCGHAEAASGICSLAKAVALMETGVIPGNLHFESPNQSIRGLVDGSMKVITEPTAFHGGYVAMNSFGFGGANAHLLLKPHGGRNVSDFDRESPELPRLVLLCSRTEHGLLESIQRVKTEALPDHALKMLNVVGRAPTQSMPRRGFVVLPTNGEAFDSQTLAEERKRPLYFIYPGMGCQWQAMGREMMHFKLFADSIHRSHEILKPLGIDLLRILTGETVEDSSLVVPFVSICAMQMALTDCLSACGIHPDGIVGHSTGELACSFADGCLNQKQTLLAAYWRGKCVEMADLPKGAMAAVGLSWEETLKRCRDGVAPACNNSSDSVTISGPADAVSRMCAELRAENIFAKEVDVQNVAYHSVQMEKIAPALQAALTNVIPIARARSARWISSSVPHDRWGEPLAKFCSPAYLSNNLVSAVRFKEALEFVPDDAICLEIAPHALLQSILKRGLSLHCETIGLMKKNAPNLVTFLSALGRLHTLNVDVDVSALYPKLEYPVPRGTPNLSRFVAWEHAEEWRVCKWNEFGSLANSAEDVTTTVDISNQDSEFFYLRGHRIDGRILFPATGYMVMAWKALAKRLEKQWEKMPIVFENLNFHRAVILHETEGAELRLDLMGTSGGFEISEGNAVVASGRVYSPENAEKILNSAIPAITDDTEFELGLDDIYKEFRLRGYEYEGKFRGIKQACTNKPFGKLTGQNDWIAFLDTLLQFSLLRSKHRSLEVPTRISECRIDPAQHYLLLGEELNDLTVFFDSSTRTCSSGGVVFKGLESSPAPRRPVQQKTLLETFEFTPNVLESTDETLTGYIETCRSLLKDILEGDRRSLAPRRSDETYKERHHAEGGSDVILSILKDVPEEVREGQPVEICLKRAFEARIADLERDRLSVSLRGELCLRPLVDLAIENTPRRRLRMAGIAFTRTPMDGDILECISRTQKSFSVDYTSFHARPELVEGDSVSELWEPNVDHRPSGYDLIVSGNLASELPNLTTHLQRMRSRLKNGGFILIDQRHSMTTLEKDLSTFADLPMSFLPTEKLEKALIDAGFDIIASRSNDIAVLLLARKLERKSCKHALVRIENQNYSWVDTLKRTLHEYEERPEGENIWLVAGDVDEGGIVGLVNCLRHESGGSRIRSIFNASLSSKEALPDFVPDDPFYREIVKRDLVMNVFRGGEWGTMRHFTLDSPGSDFGIVRTEHAFLNNRTRGDLSSLAWYQSQINFDRPAADRVLCSVYYAPLNFHDVMLATGKLPTDTMPGDVALAECVLGIEFCGRDPRGRRVMGLVHAEGLATSVVADPEFMWEVPQKWTLEEASTVPVVYSTAYYALIMRGRMREGETILIHSGSGGVGQAAITIALSMNCTVFTTVGTSEKRQFLKERFPSLRDENIASSRNTDFEALIMQRTEGRGVDLVLNSLSEEKLQASVRCVAFNGRFVEIGKFDLSKNAALGMAVFLKNVSFYGTDLNGLIGNDPSIVPEKRELVGLVTRGIESGVVQPLKRHVFNLEQAEEAFRLMAAGKHLGKVIIKVKDEEPRTQMTPSLKTVPARSRIGFSSRKIFIIIGGLGGFGLELSDWLVRRGVRNLVLTSRSGVRDGYQKLCLLRWRTAGVRVWISDRDVSIAEQAEALVLEAESSSGLPVGGIFNLAVVLRDALIENQTPEYFELVCAPKVGGTINLDRVSRERCPQLDHFVVFSSVVSGRGNAGQTSYAYANSAMERVCEKRAHDGLPGVAIQYGVVGDVGIVHRSLGLRGNELSIPGALPQTITSCLSLLDQFLSMNYPVVGTWVKANPIEERTKRTASLGAAVAHVFGIDDISKLDMDVSLADLGMDSLMSVEVKQLFERELDLTLSNREIRALTLRKIRQLESQHDTAALQSMTRSLGGIPVNSGIVEPDVRKAKLKSELIPRRTVIRMNSPALSGDPIFFVHSIDGSVNRLFDIARLMKHPVYGLQRTAHLPLDSIAKLAEAFIAEIVAVQPRGPYNLVGYSFGALVAFEIACLLQHRGHLVKSLVLLDGSPFYIAAHTSTHKARLGRKAKGDEEEALWLCFFLMEYIDTDFIKLRTSLQQIPGWAAKARRAGELLIENSKFQGGLKPTLDEVIRASKAFHEFIQAGSDYKPRRKFEGDVCLVKASKLREMAMNLPDDYRLSECINGKVNISVVEGSHEGFVQERGADQCAEIIQSTIL